jgi:curli biogenesis system outer membrane secretion channel CsgG
MKILKLVHFLYLVMTFFLISCGSAIYKHQSPDFSVTYPAYWSILKPSTDSIDQEYKNVFYAAARNNSMKIFVNDKPKELELIDTPLKAVDVIKKTLFPKSFGHKILKQELITLKDGTEAISFSIRFSMNINTIMTAICVVAFKDNKQITVASLIDQSMSTNLSEQITQSLAFENKEILKVKITKESMRIAIMEIKSDSVSKKTVNAVSNLLRTELINIGSFTIIERAQIDSILKEQGLQQTGCTDQTCVVEMGKILSARKVLVGEISTIGKAIILTTRIVDVEKGISEFGTSEKADSEDNLDKAVYNIAQKLASKIQDKR